MTFLSHVAKARRRAVSSGRDVAPRPMDTGKDLRPVAALLDVEEVGHRAVQRFQNLPVVGRLVHQSIPPLRDSLLGFYVRLSRERSDVLIDQSSIPEEVLISIPKSEAYAMRSLSLVNLTFRKQTVAITSPDGLTTDLETQESIGRVAWSFDPLGKCEQSFKEPIPYSPTARKESSKNMATLIASSLHGLRAYPAKLETVEREWTRANDLKPVLVGAAQSKERGVICSGNSRRLQPSPDRLDENEEVVEVLERDSLDDSGIDNFVAMDEDVPESHHPVERGSEFLGKPAVAYQELEELAVRARLPHART